MNVPEVGPRELQQLLQRPGRPLLLDVREPWEFTLAALPDCRHIPMGELPQRLDELDPTAPVVVLCHHGVRSLQVAYFLQRQGFREVYNLSGGIDAWSLECDPAVPRY